VRQLLAVQSNRDIPCAGIPCACRERGDPMTWKANAALAALAIGRLRRRLRLARGQVPESRFELRWLHWDDDLQLCDSELIVMRTGRGLGRPGEASAAHSAIAAPAST